MTGKNLIDDDLDRELAEDVAALARRLRDARPAPTTVFLSRVRADLEGHVSLTPGPRHGNPPG